MYAEIDELLNTTNQRICEISKARVMHASSMFLRQNMIQIGGIDNL